MKRKIQDVVVKPVKVKYPLTEHFLKLLKEGDNYLHSVYYHLFIIMEWSEIENLLKIYKTIAAGKDEHFGGEGKNCWFAAFHKSLRQTDVFDGSYRRITVETLTDKETSEMYFLSHKTSQPGYIKKGENKELFNPEYRRFLELREEYNNQKREKSIGGHLDMILYNTIHGDKQEFLYFTMMDVFTGKWK